MIDDQELRAIQFLAERVRKATTGAAPWDSAGLAANLRKLATRNLHMTIEHVMRHAADPNAKTPGVLAGTFTPPAPTGGERFRPPKRDEECKTHVGQWATSCGGCRTDQLAADNEPEVARMSRDQALATARAALTHAKHTNTEGAADA